MHALPTAVLYARPPFSAACRRCGTCKALLRVRYADIVAVKIARPVQGYVRQKAQCGAGRRRRAHSMKAQVLRAQCRQQAVAVVAQVARQGVPASAVQRGAPRLCGALFCVFNHESWQTGMNAGR